MSAAEPFTADPSSKVVPLFRTSDVHRIDAAGSFRPDPDAELVAHVLILMEAPFAVTTVSLCGAGPARHVFVVIDGKAASLSPSQAMTVAHCLFSEQAFAGCGEVAARLMEIAIEIDPSVAAARRIIPLPTTARLRIHTGRTGIASTLALVAMLLTAYVVAGLPPLMHGLG